VSKLKKEQLEIETKTKIQKMSSEGKSGDEVNRDKIKLELVMNEDPLISQLYREVLGEVEAVKRKDDSKLRDLHDRFDAYFDPDVMANKLKTDFFNEANVRDKDFIDYSTDFTDMEEQAIYMRYKKMKQQNLKDYKAAWAEKHAFFDKSEVLDEDGSIEKARLANLEK
jgi:hypothetical protein